MIDTQNSRLVGYARVSTNERELALQIDAPSAHGVTKENLFCDKLSGAREDRPGLVACLASPQHGDTLVVWRLDRPGMHRNHPRVILANKLYCDKTVCLDDICITLKISKSTLYRYVSMRGNRDARSESPARASRNTGQKRQTNLFVFDTLHRLQDKCRKPVGIGFVDNAGKTNDFRDVRRALLFSLRSKLVAKESRLTP